ncbi:hypothetical protein JCM5350_003376 [Sporobolomyces pararoseus]
MSTDADVLAEIARLSSAIDQHKQHSTTSFPPRGRGGVRGRGTFGGRGRGGVHRNSTWVAPHLPQPSQSQSQSRSGTTTPNPQTPPPPPLLMGESIPPPSTAPSTTTEREVVIGGVVFVADSRGNKLVRKTDSTLPPPPPTSTTTPASTSTSSTGSSSSSTPRRTSHLGTTYIRTKSGNLVSLQFARDKKLRNDLLKSKVNEQTLGNGIKSKRGGGVRGRGRGRGGFGRSSTTSSRVTKPVKPKSDKLCIFFQKTGQCSRAHTCRYVHDSTKISICPQFLRGNCSKPLSTCPLSHHPNSHRSPHCSHFPQCTRKPGTCPYSHVVVSGDAKVCRDFVEFGWCDLGEECKKRHVRECWRFSETGECNKKGCKEPHVLRRVHSQESQDEDEDEDDDDVDDEEEEEIEEEGMIEQEEEERDLEQELEREEKGLKRKRVNDHHQVGISGQAGRNLTTLNKRLKRGGVVRGGLQDQDDFVQLSIPSSDLDSEDEEIDYGDDDEDQEEEEDEGMSVDSDDLADEEDMEERKEEDEEKVQPVPPSTSITTTTTSSKTTSTSTTDNSKNPIAEPTITTTVREEPSSTIQTQKFVKRRHQDQPPISSLDQTDELDYGFSSAEEAEDQDEENAVGDETIYLEASEGFDFSDPPPQDQQQVQDQEEDQEEDSDEEAEDTNVANLLRR